MDSTAFFSRLLLEVQSGSLTVDEGVQRLRAFPTLELGHSALDVHRALRTGIPEVIYGAGKTPEQILEIFTRLAEVHNVLATRVTPEAADLVLTSHPDAEHDPLARTVTWSSHPVTMRPGEIIIITAGTSDLPVAREAMITCNMLGSPARIISDVGVAGIHRLLQRLDDLKSAVALIVVAGMEGALASVVGGLVPQPIIAVPTSVGYGANLGGLSALLGMLTSCASGVTVVNIDNGFGAACAAVKIHQTLDGRAMDTPGNRS